MESGDGGRTAVATGVSLLYRSTGRADRAGLERTHELADHQFQSAQRVAAELPDSTELLPAHGFGRFSSEGGRSAAASSTISKERRASPTLTRDEEDYAKDLLDALPAYYARMGPLNLTGPSMPDLAFLRQAAAGEVHNRIVAGRWVADLRTRTAFAAAHALGH